MGLVSELRRRNVFRMAALYVVAAWLIMQVAEVLMELANLPEWIGPVVLALLAIGLPIALALSWFYELTPEGVSLERDVEPGTVAYAPGRRIDLVVIALLAAGLLLFAYDKWWIGPPPEKSIAVLPFENMSADPEQEYFSDGLSEEILNLLAQLPELTVISRSSAFAFKGKDVSIPAIAAQLNVAHVLEGSVRRAGNRVRITAQLIEAQSDKHLWSETFDRELDDVFTVQDEIAAAISDALRVKLAAASGETGMPVASRARNREAYDAYLKGRELMRLRMRGNLQEAIPLLELSISLDNSFAPAHAQLAIATLLYHGYSHEGARRTAERHLDRAQELDPDLAEAYGGRALLAPRGDPESAIAYARKALAINPNYIDAMNWLRIALTDLGRHEEAQAVLERMLVTDPLSVSARYAYVTWLRKRGRFAEAHALADRIMAQSPSMGYTAHATASFWEGKLADNVDWSLRASRNHSFAWNALALVGEFDEARRINPEVSHWVYANARMWDEAIRVSQDSLRLYQESSQHAADAAEVLYFAGRTAEALPLYERALELAPEGRSISGFGPYYTMQLAVLRREAGDEDGAQAAAQLARREHAELVAAGEMNMARDMVDAMIAAFDQDPHRAIDGLQSAVQHGLRWSLFFDDPVFTGLRDDPRFVAVRRELEDLVAAEHDKVLQLICFNNPVPDEWQPMPETCEGVEERRR